MHDKNETYDLKRRQGFEWIQGASGTSYLCPLGSIHDKTHVSEEQLKKVCIDESSNVHND
jgi:hypothetical protein